jgi:hypothetical protein
MSGAIAAGKTTAAQLLAERYSGQLVRVRQALADVLGLANADRETLQREGATLDILTDGRWLVEYVLAELDRRPFVVVDSMRTKRQTLPLLSAVPSADLIYLRAHVLTCRDRYQKAARTDPVKASVSFDEAMAHSTELEVVRLQPYATLVLETDDLTAYEVAHEISDRLHWP